MPDERSNGREAERASPPPPVAGKKKKRSKIGTLFIMLALAAGVGLGLHFSGYWDARPLVWGVVPKLPYIGAPLAQQLGIPERFSLTVDQRRALELEEWQLRLDERDRSLTAQRTELDSVSDDIEAARSRLDQSTSAANAQAESAEKAVPNESEKNLIDQVAKTYQDMSPRNAAQIVEQLHEELAVDLLRKLPIDARAAILGKMEPRKAARITERMSTGNR